MDYNNEVVIVMDSKSQNEAFARIVVSAFVAPLDPTMDELTDIKTAVSEAVTNAIIHGYEKTQGKVELACMIKNGDEITITVEDFGVGIDDIDAVMEPLYTSKPEMERSGMGFTVMESFMDSVSVSSVKGKGTKVSMSKKICRG